jgi:hypothetical protein
VSDDSTESVLEEELTIQRYRKMVELHKETQKTIQTLRSRVATLASPTQPSAADDRPEGVAFLLRLISTLDEVAETAREGETQLRAELNRLLGKTSTDLEMPLGLARFISERSEDPGFEYEVSRDPIRGTVLRWRERDDEGWIRASGFLYENPHAWLED